MTIAYTEVETVEVERNGWTKLAFTGFGQGSNVMIEWEDGSSITQVLLSLVKLDERS